MFKVLNLIGTSDSNRAKVVWNNGNPAELKIVFEGTNTLFLLMDPARMHISTATFGGRHPKQIVLPDADVIVNSVCDPDTNTKALLQIREVLKNGDTPVVNPPELIFRTTREQTYAHLNGLDGLTVPSTVRIAPREVAEVPGMVEESGLTYPYIFRSAGEHGGGGMVLVESEADLPKLERFAFDGRDFYVIAFHDFRDDDGYYRKYRLVVIDGKVFPRHLIVSTSWNIHSQTRAELMDKEPRYQKEEIAFLQRPPDKLEVTCRRIHEKMPLDFFGIDCHLDAEGNMFIFELNTCMRIIAGQPLSYQKAALEAIITAFGDMLSQKAHPA